VRRAAQPYRSSGIRDVLIVCCDGLPGFPEAIEATCPQATVQTCTVHLIRAATRFVSYQDRKRVAAALRPIYTASTVDAAESELLAFAESDLGRLPTVPAAIVGGTAITGGVTNPLNVVFGALTITLIPIGAATVGVPPQAQSLVYGLVITITVALTRRRASGEIVE
jgi:predicted ABC-type sugar transport system permease subunit